MSIPRLLGLHHALDDRLGRTRAAVVTSRQSIARSRERIDSSLRVVAQCARGFSFSAPLADDQTIDAADERDAADEQREIEREVRQTARGAFHLPELRR